MESSAQQREPLSHSTLPEHLPRSASLNAIPATRRHSGFFTSFYNSLSLHREPDRASDRASRRASTLVTTRDTEAWLEKLAAENAEKQRADMQNIKEEHDEDYVEEGEEGEEREEIEDEEEDIPAVPPFYGRQDQYVGNAQQAEGRYVRKPAHLAGHPPVSYNAAGRGNSASQSGSPGLRRVPMGRGSGGASDNSPAPTKAPPPSPDYNPEKGPDPFWKPDGTRHASPLRSNPPKMAASNMNVSVSHGEVSRPNQDTQGGSRVTSASHIPVSSLRPRALGASNTANRDTVKILSGEIKKQMKSMGPLKQENIRPMVKNSDSGYAVSAKNMAAYLKNPEIVDAIQSAPRHHLRKSPSRILNLNEVAEGAAPISRDTQPVFGSSDHAAGSQTDLRQYGNSGATYRDNDDVEEPVRVVKHKKSMKTFFSGKKNPDHASDVTKKQSKHNNLVVNSPADFGVKALTDESGMDETDVTTTDSIIISVDKVPTNNQKSIPKSTFSRFPFNKKGRTVEAEPLLGPSMLSQVSEDDQLRSPDRKYHSAMNLASSDPSAIPGPVQDRNFTAPVMGSRPENEYPRRLMREIPPGGLQAPPLSGRMGRSRTANMLSTLRPGFTKSRSNLTSASTLSLAADGRNLEATTQLSTEPATAEFPGSALNLQVVSQAMDLGYWTGRMSALNDAFQNETLTSINHDPELLQRYLDPSIVYDCRAREMDPIKAADRAEHEPSTAGMRLMLMDQDSRAFRAFEYLRGQCTTAEAERSFWEWQQAYARINSKKEFLPQGGSMTDTRPGLVGRIVDSLTGRSDGGEEGTKGVAGRRTGLSSIFGKREK